MAMMKPGLYSNIRAKQERIAEGSKEKMRKPGAVAWLGCLSRGRVCVSYQVAWMIAKLMTTASASAPAVILRSVIVAEPANMLETQQL